MPHTLILVAAIDATVVACVCARLLSESQQDPSVRFFIFHLRVSRV